MGSNGSTNGSGGMDFVFARDRGETYLLFYNFSAKATAEAYSLPGAMLLGLALDLYRSDDEKPDQNGNGHGEGNGRVRADPMTAFWLAVRERELSREEGKALLERAGGDPAHALTLLDS